MNPGTILTFLGVVLVAILGALPGLVALWQSRRKTKAATKQTAASTADVLTDMALSLIKPLGRRVEDLEVLVKRQTKEIETLQAAVKQLGERNRQLCEGAHRLVEQVCKLGAEPVWIPESWQPGQSAEAWSGG